MRLWKCGRFCFLLYTVDGRERTSTKVWDWTLCLPFCILCKLLGALVTFFRYDYRKNNALNELTFIKGFKISISLSLPLCVCFSRKCNQNSLAQFSQFDFSPFSTFLYYSIVFFFSFCQNLNNFVIIESKTVIILFFISYEDEHKSHCS